MSTAANTKLEALAASYARALHTYENNQLGEITDRAMARMERISDQADALGLSDELATALGY
jgi:hypothetical protein